MQPSSSHGSTSTGQRCIVPDQHRCIASGLLSVTDVLQTPMLMRTIMAHAFLPAHGATASPAAHPHCRTYQLQAAPPGACAGMVNTNYRPNAYRGFSYHFGNRLTEAECCQQCADTPECDFYLWFGPFFCDMHPEYGGCSIDSDGTRRTWCEGAILVPWYTTCDEYGSGSNFLLGRRESLANYCPGFPQA